MARKVDEAANFVFVRLIDKCHTDYARQGKINLAWKEFLMRQRNLDPD
jgi:hypothetical protein